MAMAGSSAGRVFRIERDRLVIGRSKQADIAITDPGVSRSHCAVLRKRSGEHFVEDLGSTNGTIVNGGRVERVELAPGDRIQLGPEAVFQFGFFDDAEEGLANQLYEAATRDPLTKVYNRRHFYERLVAESAYAKRHKDKLVVLLIDIDFFKTINDSYGHAAGDHVLREIATSIGKTLRSEDVFARFGGEEFVLLARGLSLRNGVRLAERVRDLVEAAIFEFESHRFRVTVSVGVAELGEADKVAEGMLRIADGRLYAAKRQGRNRVVGK